MTSEVRDETAPLPRPVTRIHDKFGHFPNATLRRNDCRYRQYRYGRQRSLPEVARTTACVSTWTRQSRRGAYRRRWRSRATRTLAVKWWENGRVVIYCASIERDNASKFCGSTRMMPPRGLSISAIRNSGIDKITGRTRSSGTPLRRSP
jgi:hypothetical protein